MSFLRNPTKEFPQKLNELIAHPEVYTQFFPEHITRTWKKKFSDHCKIPSTLHWNVKISYDRFSFWWLLGFVIPPLRQLPFPEREWLLAERGRARNIAIWPASSHALLTQTHTWKNNGVTGVAPFKLYATTRSRHEPTDTCASKKTERTDRDPPGARPRNPRRKIYAHTEGPSRGSGDRGYSRAPDNLSTAR